MLTAIRLTDHAELDAAAVPHVKGPIFVLFGSEGLSIRDRGADCDVLCLCANWITPSAFFSRFSAFLQRHLGDSVENVLMIGGE